MKLPFDEQMKIYRVVKDNPDTYKQSVLAGYLQPTRAPYESVLAQEEFKTQDPDTLKIKSLAMKLAARQECVVITGESGTGKELLARILHGARGGDFVAVNSCAVTETLFESELFGHVRGAFTGADRDRDGLIKQTEGERGEQGTLFLDEIGDLDIHMQPKLLRVIQNKTYRRVGSNKDESVRCRIIAATHQNLREMIEKKQFRLDLFERLNVFHLHVKPLRERIKDVKIFWPSISGDTRLELLFSTARLSGNVRQLLNLRLRAETLGVETIGEGDVL